MVEGFMIFLGIALSILIISWLIKSIHEMLRLSKNSATSKVRDADQVLVSKLEYELLKLARKKYSEMQVTDDVRVASQRADEVHYLFEKSSACLKQAPSPGTNSADILELDKYRLKHKDLLETK